MSAVNGLIHTFDPSQPDVLDEFGDVMVGSYYQLIDGNDEPVSDLIGPYRDNEAAEAALKRAFARRDF